MSVMVPTPTMSVCIAATRRALAPALLAGLLLSLGLAGCRGATKNNDAIAAATTVGVARALSGPAMPMIRTHGLLSNQEEIRLAFKVGGVIRQLSVDEGEQVGKGQKLAQIEQTEIEAQVEQARQAQQKAQRDLARGERLHADQVISLEQLQDLRTQSAMAKAALDAAEFNRSYATILAPHDGAILRRLAEERELVTAGEPILVLGVRDGGYVVNTGLADREVVQIKLGDPVEIRLDAWPQQLLEGAVTRIASAADPSNGMFRIEIAIDPVDLPLRSGLVAKLTIVPNSASAAQRVRVPIGAIVEGRADRASIFVLAQEQGQLRARRREVQVAFIEGEQVALASGIETGERVITDGALYLEDGEVVEVSEPRATPPAQ